MKTLTSNIKDLFIAFLFFMAMTSTLCLFTASAFAQESMDNTEVEALQTASAEQLKQIEECENDLRDEKSTDRSAFSACVNDVLGDVHN